MLAHTPVVLRRLLEQVRWSAVAIIVFSVVVPLLLFGWMAAQEQRRAFRDDEDMARRTVRALHEHALRAIQSNEILLRYIEGQVRGRSWDEIGADRDLHEALARLVAISSSTLNITLVDGNGKVRASARDFPAPGVSLADRDYFAELARGDRELAVGAPLTGRLTGGGLFPLAVRRTSASGEFDGMVVAGVPVEYFTNFWKGYVPSVAYVIPMMRADGQLLVRYPANDNPPRLDPNGPFMRQIAASPSGVYTARSQVDGIERLNAYSKVGDYPVYVSFSVETRAILDHWREEIRPFLWGTLLAIATLLFLCVVLIRHMNRERKALENWREAANALATEMSRREVAEESLRQAQKMEIIGQITGGVAHDFNNLLQVLSNNLHLAALTSPAGTDVRRYIASALDTTQRGAKLTKQLLAFSRRQTLAPEPVAPSSLLGEMANLLRSTLGATIELRMDVPHGMWPAMIDRNQAEMAILNLVVNARDAIPRGGVIAIEAANATVRQGERPGLQAGDYVTLSVRDNGTGMPPEVAKRAFEPFFTTKEVGKGSGLGLSQVHGFAAQSGGAAYIVSEPGAGTTVTLYLPRAPQETAVHAPHARAPTRTGQHAILLVDDDDEVRHGVAAGLIPLGYRVFEAPSAVEALKLLVGENDIEILVTDYLMPGMRGNELARLAQERRPELAVVLISGYAQLPEAEVARWTVVRKPFTPEELAAKIADAAGRALEQHR